MWTKTLTVKYKNQKFHVQVWLDTEEHPNILVVRVQSMANEYFLGEKIVFESRDAAYDFIKHYPISMTKAFLIREGYNQGALT